MACTLTMTRNQVRKDPSLLSGRHARDLEGDDPRFRDEVVAMTPMKRWGTPEDVAAAAVFLASDDAGFLTGQMIMVNGGVV